MENLITRNTQAEVNLIERNGQHSIQGYGALYYDGTSGTEYQLDDNLFERFSKGAFDRPLAEKQNIEVRYNHSQDYVLGDTSNTAEVKVDERGLRYSVPFDSNDPDHAKVKAKIEKHLIKGSSIAGVPVYRFDRENGKDIAWVVSMKTIRDLGPVNSPAYKAAPAMMRNAELDEQYKEWLRLKNETEKRIAKHR
jgi:HK97 family phage prohead protease